MKSSHFTAKNIIVQGITGSHGRFQTKAMLTAGTTIIAGTTPGKAGQVVEGVPVYDSIADIQKEHVVDTTVIFVPAQFAKSAIIEAITARIPLIVCITEGVPIHDMIQIKKRLENSGSFLIGPNSPGVIVPGVNKLGIIPANMSLPGRTAIVSRSGTLTYETMAGLSAKGIGQRYVIGIGGDRIRGTGFIECLELFENDPEVDQIVMIGEIGGIDEQLAADYIAKSVTKPVFAYVAGHHAPVGVQLGHAGAILGSADESAASKTEALEKAGAKVATSITGLIKLIVDK
ncbi:succinate--CoA ligase subunit alpha [Candidatus Saccharibacteria bacterium]|nr:succinate--CoA ligase subunit alpha [Candidatus Saccharibacteria bacterium]